jgi:hypothetical protein
MMNSRCEVKENIDELIKRSNEVKIELDNTPYEDEKKFIRLLRRLIKVHKDLNEMND